MDEMNSRKTKVNLFKISLNFQQFPTSNNFQQESFVATSNQIGQYKMQTAECRMQNADWV